MSTCEIYVLMYDDTLNKFPRTSVSVASHQAGILIPRETQTEPIREISGQASTRARRLQNCSCRKASLVPKRASPTRRGSIFGQSIRTRLLGVNITTWRVKSHGDRRRVAKFADKVAGGLDVEFRREQLLSHKNPSPSVQRRRSWDFPDIDKPSLSEKQSQNTSSSLGLL